MSIALVFPGQGVQEVGMGSALAAQYPAARAVFDAADAAFPDDPVPLSRLCFEGPEEALTLTANTQPAVLTTSLACLAALRARVPGLAPAFVAGHSLGEYTALVVAGALDLATALRLLRLRGQAMQDAVPAGVGAMSAILMLDDGTVDAICAEARAALPGRVVQAANRNAPGQVVVAGHAEAVDYVGRVADQRKGKPIPLKVSAPFHCELMAPAAARLDAALAEVRFGAFATPVVTNVEAASNTDPARVRELLVRQVCGTVRWAESLRAMLDAGVTRFVEVGPGDVLRGLMKRISRPTPVHAVRDLETLDEAVRALGG
jgi:[acyl-carrier-protein] S-malonyltransferase